MNPPKIELKPAYSWDCDNCGRENFERAIVPEMSPEDLAQLKEDHGVEEWETGQFLMAPTMVKCKFCQTDYETIHPMEVEDD